MTSLARTLTSLLALPSLLAAEPPQDPLIHEARIRTQLLQESIHGSLQIMHRDFFDPNDRDRIPSAALEDVFQVLTKLWGVELRWLGVNAKTMDADHEPVDAFERDAVAALARGAEEFEALEGEFLRHVTAIPLHNTCLKCHVPHRTTLEDRVAGLAVRMPLRPRRTAETEE